jgi:hypothetical protein
MYHFGSSAINVLFYVYQKIAIQSYTSFIEINYYIKLIQC